MRFEVASLLVLVAFSALADASSIRNRRSVGSNGRYWPYTGFRTIPHRVVRGDAADKPVRTCGLVLVTLTRQICDQECAPPGMMPLALVDDDPQEPERRKRMGHHELSFRCCTKGCTRAEIKANFCCNPAYTR